VRHNATNHGVGTLGSAPDADASVGASFVAGVSLRPDPSCPVTIFEFRRTMFGTVKFRHPVRAHVLSEALARLFDKIGRERVSVMHVCGTLGSVPEFRLVHRRADPVRCPHASNI